jgi:hypothetical protein
MKVFNAGDVLPAADVNEYLVNTKFVSKPGDTPRNTTTTLANDPDLTVAVDANKSYWTEVRIQFLDPTSGTANFKVAFTVPAGATFNGEFAALGVGASTYQANAVDSAAPITTAIYHVSGSFGDTSCRLSGVLATAGAAGSLTLQWAQNTSNGSNVTVRAGSSMFLRRVA